MRFLRNILRSLRNETRPDSASSSSASDADRAVELNARGLELSDAGDNEGAIEAYRAAAKLAPWWSVPVYNIGLRYKYALKWRESFEYNQTAARLAEDDEASWWNLGIAATALGEWTEARRAWTACGIEVPPGDGPPEFEWGNTPVRLSPDGDAEVVWAKRLDPARSRIVSIPLPASTFHYGDIVLTDGAEDGQRLVNGHAYPVFNVLQKLQASDYRTFVVEVATSNPDALSMLHRIAEDHGGAVEDWGTFTSILCADCSRGVPHEHSDASSNPAHPHWGLAARDSAHAQQIVDAWLASTVGSDVTRWYEVPPHRTTP
jgi:hypothetical protein